jgi:mannose-1-phosphate guanylyltransferase/mannose-6-phosphate isomerase
MKMEKKIQVVPIILAGGSGTRLWPLSRSDYPKQFLVFSDNKTLFQQSVLRLNELDSTIDTLKTVVVANEENRFLILDQMKELDPIDCDLLLEPCQRNTAAALTLGVLQAAKDGQDPIIIATPSDHIIEDNLKFLSVLKQAVLEAENGSIVTLGIRPSKPSTDFGYIRFDPVHSNSLVQNVIEFVEKPNLETARIYLESGSYYWNSGIFVMKSSLWLKALNQFRPDIKSASEDAFNLRTFDDQFIRPDVNLFEKIQSESIDYAVMEKCNNSSFNLKTIQLDAKWNDLGTWHSVTEFHSNHPQGDALIEDCENTFVFSSSRLVATLGVSNLIVIETPDAVLVADKNKVNDVKKIIHKLDSKNRMEHKYHRKVYRPWGWYDVLSYEDNYKVKKILINPGKRLSLQKHHFRSEHWVIIKGKAEVTRGVEKIILYVNESIFIPKDVIHCILNKEDTPLEIIEIQTGSQVEEEDIYRIDDPYNRDIKKRGV